MKAILMSIHPEWCEKIFNKTKTMRTLTVGAAAPILVEIEK